MSRRIRKLIRLPGLLLALTAAAAAQQTGSISGAVTDPQGKAIVGASVEVDNVEGTLQRTAKTDASGNYAVHELPAGTYLVVVQAEGFDAKTSDQLTLAAGQQFTFNQQLTSVKGTGVTVTVQGNNAAAVELDSATLSGEIPTEKVVELGLNGRNFSTLITTTAGVSNQSGQDEAKVGVAGSAKFSVNGGRVEYNTFMVDGSDVLNTSINASRGQGEPLIVYPSIDAIQDIQVLTANYGAKYGKTASGSVIVNTKTGGAEFHGNLYAFIRNEAFNARNYFDLPGRTPLYRRQDYGGTLGGPIYIPNRYNTKKDKSYFFFSEELRLEKTPVDYNQAVPTVAERSGDFSDVCPADATNPPAGGYSGGYGNYYPGAAYPDCPVAAPDGSGKNPGFNYAHVNVNYDAQAMLASNVIPLPNSTFGCNTTNPTALPHCYDAAVSPPTYWREELFRIDHNITPSELLTFRYIHDAWNTTTLTPQWGIVEDSFPTVENKLLGPGLDLVANLTQTLPHSFLNRITFAFSVEHISLTPQPGPGVTSLARPAILDNAGPSVTSGSAVSGAPLCSVVTGGTPTPPNQSPPPQQLTECPMGQIFSNGFGNKLPGLVFEGNNGEYGGHGFNADTGYAPWNMSNPTYVIRDDAAKTWGKHGIEFGGEADIVQQNELSAVSGANSGDVQGLFTFSNQQSKNSSNNAFADFLAGPGLAPLYSNGSGGLTQEWGDATTAIKSFQQDSGQGRYYDRYKMAELYIQDNWKATNRLTLNFGFRASFFGTWYNARNTAYNWETQAYNQSIGQSVHVDPTNGFLIQNLNGLPLPLTVPGADPNGPYSLSTLSPQVVNGLVQCGVNGVPKSCMTPHVFNPAPRIGLAWDPFGTGRTSIRAGYGLFWEHGTSYEANTGSLIGGAPLILSETQLNPGPLRTGYVANSTGANQPGAYNVIGLSCQEGSAQCNYGNAALASGSPTGSVTFPLNVTSIPTKAVYSYTQQWSLSVQREMRNNLLATVAYVGTKGTHLTAVQDLNQLQPLPGSLNPFPAGQPITNDICASGAATGTFPVSGTNAGTGVSSSGGIGPTQPGYLNMEIVCTGFPGFVYTSTSSNAGQPISLTADSVRPYLGLSNILSVSNIANSNYSALQATLHETKGPLVIGMAYTYSHSFDEASDRATANFANSLNVKGNYASSDFDERQLLSVDYIYDLPLMRLLTRFTSFSNESDDDDSTGAGKAATGTPPAATWQSARWLQTALNHWQFSGIVAYQSGTPFSVINAGSATGVGAQDNAGVGDALGIGSFADRIGNPRGVKPQALSSGPNLGPLLLNPAAFAAPRGLTFGDSGRNSVNNPSRTNFNMALLKHFSTFGQEDNVEFRAEAFNVFNHTQFRIYDPSHPGNSGNNVVNCYGPIYAQYSAGFVGDQQNASCLAGNSFLHPVDAHDPRILQLGLKLAF
jgi:hypothetical protein